MASKKIVVVGSSNTDMIIKTPRIPRPGETVLGGEFSIAAGGKGANQAVAAARAGGKVSLVARVGRDMFGEQAITALARDGIDISLVFQDPGAPSGVALIFVGEGGENSIAVASGANARLSTEDVMQSRDAISSSALLLMQLETPLDTIQAAADIAVRSKVKVILNPAPARPVPAELLKRASILTPNEHEAEVLTGIKVEDEQSANQAAEALLARGAGAVLITLGAHGVYVAAGKKREITPGYKVEAVDSTGAGDVFNGALAVALAEGKTIQDAACFANAAAALSVTRLGAQPSIPRRDEIDAFLSRHAVSG